MAKQWLADLARWQQAEQVVPHLCVDISGGTTWKWDRPCNTGFQCREIKPQNLWLKKPLRVEAVGKTPSLTGEFVGETHRILEHTQNHPPRNQHQKGTICLWVAAEVTGSWQRLEQVGIASSRSLPHLQRHNTVMWVAPPWWISKALPLTM